MSINYTTTAEAVDTVNALIYGPSGVGKTTLATTYPDAVIVSSEKGTMSIAEHALPVLAIENTEDLREVAKILKKNKQGFKLAFVDSVTDIAETCLAAKKKDNKDARAAFYATQDDIQDCCRLFRDLKMHTVVIARHDLMLDASGLRINGPSMPSKKLSNDLPYIFDVVMAMRMEDGEDGEDFRYIQTNLTHDWYAKDRSRSLKAVMQPDLSVILDRIDKTLKKRRKQHGKGKK